MATVEHKDLTDPDLHEPAGISTANENELYISDGVGSGAWGKIPYACLKYLNIGTGSTVTTPTSYTIINPTTVQYGGISDFSHSGSCSFQHIGSTTRDILVTVSAAFVCSATDIYFAVYNEGVYQAVTETVVRGIATTYNHIALQGVITCAPNDHITVYVRAATGNVVIHELTMVLRGM